jgi:hypothetical protein
MVYYSIALWKDIIADYRTQDKIKAPCPETGAFVSVCPSRLVRRRAN